MNRARLRQDSDQVDKNNLLELLSTVEFNAETNSIDGVIPFQTLLLKDKTGEVLRFLEAAMLKLEGKKQCGIGFILAQHYVDVGALEKLKGLYLTDDGALKEYISGALAGEPKAHPEMGSSIVNLAIAALKHTCPRVRSGACFIIQSQCAWGVDVTESLDGLRALLDDDDARVRQSAAYALGNAAKRRYKVAECIEPLCVNLRHEKNWVRNASAWALRNLSRSNHDIEKAVPALVQILKDDDEWKDPQMNAAGALLGYAKKSRVNAARLKAAVGRAEVNRNCKAMRRFLAQLANLN